MSVVGFHEPHNVGHGCLGLCRSWMETTMLKVLAFSVLIGYDIKDVCCSSVSDVCCLPQPLQDTHLGSHSWKQ